MTSKVERNQVFQTTRVRTSLKKDASWIQTPEQKNKEEDNARTDQDMETKATQASYVLSTAKKFDDSVNQANEDIPPQNDAQPEVATIDDTALQAPTLGDVHQNGEAQPEKPEPEDSTNADSKEEYADTAVDLSNAEHDAAEVSADAHVEEHVPNGEADPLSPTNTNPEAVSPVEPSHRPADVVTAESNEVHTDTAADQSSVGSVSADAPVVNPAAESSAEETKEGAEVPAALDVKPQEELSTETEPINATSLEDAGTESTAQPAEEGGEKRSPERAAGETAEGVADVMVESSPETPAVTEAPVLDHVQQVPDLLPSQPAAESATEGSCEKETLEQAAGETVESGTDATEEPAVQDGGESVPDLLAKSEFPSQPAADTAMEGSSAGGPSDQAAGESVEAVVEVNVVSSPAPSSDSAEEEAAVQDSVEQVPDLLVSSEPAAEGSIEAGPPEQTAGETVEAVGEVKVETPPAPADDLGEEAAVPDGEEQVPDLLASELSRQLAADSRAEDVVECHVQPVVVEQSLKPAPEIGAELSINDAIEPTAALDSEAAEEELTDRAIELTDALDVEPPASDAAPEPPEQSHTEERELNQQSDHTSISQTLDKPAEEPQPTQSPFTTRDGRYVCTLCDKTIEGNVRILFSEPRLGCHPDCLKCGMCAKALGDLLTPLFLHNQEIICDVCFAITLKT